MVNGPKKSILTRIEWRQRLQLLQGQSSHNLTTQSLEFPLAYDALVAVVLTNLWKIVPGNQEATSDISNSSSNT